MTVKGRRNGHPLELYFTVFAIGVPQEVRDMRLPLVITGAGGDVNGSPVTTHARMFSCPGQRRNPHYGFGPRYSLRAPSDRMTARKKRILPRSRFAQCLVA